MNKREWQEFHGLTDSDMQQISDILATFGGSIKAVNTRKPWGPESEPRTQIFKDGMWQ